VDKSTVVSCYALERLLLAVGWKVETFASAQEFLAYRIPDIPSCLVLDVELPGVSGLDLQKRLEEANRAIPIVFITGYGDVPKSVRAMKAGAVEFLIKPL
jgi:FixJ family two-component response regulator